MKKNMLMLLMSFFMMGCSLNVIDDSIVKESKENNTVSLEVETTSNKSEEIKTESEKSDEKSEEKKSEELSSQASEQTILFSNGLEQHSEEELLSIFLKQNTNHYGLQATNKLAEPASTVNSRKELADILDYMAFYHIETFDVNLNYQFTSLKSELNHAFWNSLICPGTVGLDCKGNTIEMLFNANANSYHENSQAYSAPTVPFSFESTLAKRNADNDNFGYLTKNTNGNLDVYNSDQLLYALETGYKPIIAPDSPALAVYNKAKEILNSIIYDDMTIEQKVLAIECYLFSNATYDYYGDEMASYESSSLVNFPDYMASNFTGFYSDGVLLNGKGVCHGFAKAFNILATMEGLKAIKISTPFAAIDVDNTLSCNIAGQTGQNVFSSHGYSYVLNETDNKYYICDPTYNLGTYVNSCQVYRNLGAMIDFDSWKKTYQDTAPDWFYNQNKSQMGSSRYLWQRDFKMIVNDETVDLYVESVDEMQALCDNIFDYVEAYNDPSFYTNNTFLFEIYFDQSTYAVYERQYLDVYYEFCSQNSFFYTTERWYNALGSYIVMVNKLH